MSFCGHHGDPLPTFTVLARVSPVEWLTLRTALTPEAWPTVALACEHVAVGAQGVLGVTATGLTACVLAVVPVVRGTLVTVGAHHVSPAGTPAAPTVTATLPASTGRGLRPRRHTAAPSAVLGQGVAIVTLSAVVAGGAVSLVQAAQALAGAGVT